jgi:hypothetical protein
MLHRASDLDGLFRTKSATKNGHEIRKLEYHGSLRSGTLKAVARELAKYKLDLVAIQEVGWDKGGTEPAGNYTFIRGHENVTIT